MDSSLPWQPSFIAMSAALGEPLDVIVDSLEGSAAEHAPELVRGLRSKSRSTRATAMAAALAVIASELDRMAAA